MQALYLDIAPGRRFALWLLPGIRVRRLVVHAHAFAEEMNKSRRMVAQQARALASEGAAVLVPDLYGCGDSDGDLVQARWAGWIDDVVAAGDWALGELGARGAADGVAERWLWGHRLGALLAAAAAQRLPGAWSLLFWQPVLQGRLAVQQFLRLDGAAALIGKSRDSGRASARSLLAAGQSAEIAGYEIAPALIDALGAARLDPPARAARVAWLDMVADADGGPLPAAAAEIERWRAAGWHVHWEHVAGPAFWQTNEIEEVPALIAATSRSLSAERAGP
jgi:exosortase A-associated hydrolase 2